MKRNIRLVIGFDGTNYHGWQRQAQVSTIQGTIEERLAMLIQEKIVLHGAGRTDAGVHAEAMVAHFHSHTRLDQEAIRRGLNSLLPPDIRIFAAQEVEHAFHSRFSAQGKQYRYDLFTGEVLPPWKRRYMAHLSGPFNLQPLQAGLRIIGGTHDFTSFEGAGSRDRTLQHGRGAIRTLFTAQVLNWPDHPFCYSFFFIGDGFLRHMVRNLVGTLHLPWPRETLPVMTWWPSCGPETGNRPAPRPRPAACSCKKSFTGHHHPHQP